MRHTRPTFKGFTLIEILIVVIILGILAAIVIPQFSSASNDARLANLQSTVQTLRSQVALYRLQHLDRLPNGTSTANFWTQMTSITDANGNVVAAGTANSFGPYMQDVPTNPLTVSTSVINGTTATAGAGFIYDYGTTGNGTGKVWGVDQNGALVAN